MRGLKSAALVGILLATSVGVSSGEGTSTKYISPSEYVKEEGGAQPPQKENRYPERFPALVRGYDFSRLGLRRVSKF